MIHVAQKKIYDGQQDHLKFINHLLKNDSAKRSYVSPSGKTWYNPHHFSDAPELGYEQCWYIRMVTATGRFSCSLLLGKLRVLPKKFISIARMELNADVLSVKVACLLKKELKFGEMKKLFWTDSKAVRDYIKNNANIIF